MAAPSPGALQARQIADAGGSRLWLTCDAGVLATTDGGRTWELQKVAAGLPQAIAAADEQHVLATTGLAAIRRQRPTAAPRGRPSAAAGPRPGRSPPSPPWRPSRPPDLRAASGQHARQGPRRGARIAMRRQRRRRRAPRPIGWGDGDAHRQHELAPKALVADVLLFSVAIFWGSNFVFIKDVVARTTESPPAASSPARCCTGAPVRGRHGRLRRCAARSWLGSSRGDWARGGLLRAFDLTALILQTVGLQRTSPGVSGFITGISVAIVPFLY